MIKTQIPGRNVSFIVDKIPLLFMLITSSWDSLQSLVTPFNDGSDSILFLSGESTKTKNIYKEIHES